jgi:hypothetical protein
LPLAVAEPRPAGDTGRMPSYSPTNYAFTRRTSEISSWFSDPVIRYRVWRRYTDNLPFTDAVCTDTDLDE